MQLVGLTGGIAAGKSTIASRLVELGAHIIDADQIARDVVEPGEPALAAIQAWFGDAVITDGRLDRPALARIVFEDASARRDLERITHPAVRTRTAERIAEFREADHAGIVVYEVPLLAETGDTEPFDTIVVAHAPAAVRIERLRSLRGMSAVEARRRVDAQASDAERLAIADVVIDTAGPLDATRAQVDALWQRLRSESA